MSKMFRQHRRRHSVGILINEAPTLISHHERRSSTYQRDGVTQATSCIGCWNAPCLRFSPFELEICDDRLSGFPADADDSVCPLNAITWEREATTPVILPELCINCGVCARRCPVGAIYSEGGSAVIHTGEPGVRFAEATPENVSAHREQLLALLGSRHDGKYLAPTETSINSLYERLGRQQAQPQFPNLIVRNLFLVLGNRCIIRRRGDVYFRIDAIVADKTNVGVAEVEFHSDMLESPRSILDDIAVLTSRYGINQRMIQPFVVSFELPNRRSEYWRVIKDIRDVLDISIHTLTVGALCMLAWSFVDVPISTVNFYADIDSLTIRDSIEALCGPVELSSSYAVLEPMK